MRILKNPQNKNLIRAWVAHTQQKPKSKRDRNSLLRSAGTWGTGFRRNEPHKAVCFSLPPGPTLSASRRSKERKGSQGREGEERTERQCAGSTFSSLGTFVTCLFSSMVLILKPGVSACLQLQPVSRTRPTWSGPCPSLHSSLSMARALHPNGSHREQSVRPRLGLGPQIFIRKQRKQHNHTPRISKCPRRRGSREEHLVSLSKQLSVERAHGTCSHPSVEGWPDCASVCPALGDRRHPQEGLCRGGWDSVRAAVT